MFLTHHASSPSLPHHPAQGQTLAINHAFYPKMQQGITMESIPGSASGGYGQMATSGMTFRSMQPMGGAQLVSIQSAPAVQEAGLYEAYGPGTGGDQVEQYIPGGGGASQLDQLGQVAISMALNQQQFAVVNSHLYSVQAMSGCQLHVTPGAPGVFHLVISGSKPQVEGARNLLSTILGQGM